MKNNKKGDIRNLWVEYSFLLLIIIGFFVAFNIQNNFIIYLLSYIAGFHCGFLTYRNIKTNMSFSVWLVIIGFLIGFLIGSYDANKISIIILFILGIINGHVVFDKNPGIFIKGYKSDKKSSK